MSSWEAHVRTLREAELVRQATRARERFVVVEVRADGVPVDRQAFEELEDALDLRDELHRQWPGQRVFRGVVDRDDPERGMLDWEDVHVPVEVPA